MTEPTTLVGLAHRFVRTLTGPLFRRTLMAVLAAALAAPSLPAQSAGTGTVEGRVQNAVTGDYLNNARVAETARAATASDLLFGKYLLLRKGKRTYAVIDAV